MREPEAVCEVEWYRVSVSPHVSMSNEVETGAFLCNRERHSHCKRARARRDRTAAGRETAG